jgi:hypothetical protein
MKAIDATLIHAVHGLLHQLHEVLQKLDERDYQHSSEILSGSSIGGHVRHTLEFFTCLLDGHQSGMICYDNRKRDLEIEKSPTVAMDTIGKITRKLGELTHDKAIELHSLIAPEESNLILISSSLERELWYTIEHAIHHFAIIKIGILSLCPEVNLPQNFGVASSTVSYQLSQAE